jgi:ubiquinol-cytochrome c reductase cytochrome b subunit
MKIFVAGATGARGRSKGCGVSSEGSTPLDWMEQVMRLRRGRKATPAQGGREERGDLDRFERTQNWLDERLGTTSFARRALRTVFPDHWSFLLGEIALGCLVVLVVTGVFLTFFYTPDPRGVTYDGPYAPLKGEQVSAAYDSTMRLSFEVKAGLLMRQTHHWSTCAGSSSPGRSDGRGS